MADLFYSSVAVKTTLTGTIDTSATTIQVASVTGFPQSYPFKLILDPDTAVEEIVYVQAAVGLQLDVLRGRDGTTGLAHGNGAAIIHGATGDDFQRASNHRDLTAAHGATGAVVGTTNPQTLTNKSVDGSQNTLTNIAQSSVTGLVTKVSEVDGHIAAIEAHGATGAVVGTTNTQTLTNKSVSGSTNTLTNIPRSALATADFPVDVDWTAQTLASGWTGDMQRTRKMGVVTVTSIASKDTPLTDGESTIATLPSGWRPAQDVRTVGWQVVSSGIRFHGVSIDTLGVVRSHTRGDNPGLAGGVGLRFSISFPVN